MDGFQPRVFLKLNLNFIKYKFNLYKYRFYFIKYNLYFKNGLSGGLGIDRRTKATDYKVDIPNAHYYGWWMDEVLEPYIGKCMT